GVTLAAILQPLAARRRVNSSSTPPVTVVMPIYGLESELSQNLDNIFDQDYPQFSVSLAFARADDPAIELTNAARKRRPAVHSELLIGEAVEFPNLKVRNEYKCLDGAATDFVCIVDSNTSLAPDTVRKSMALMGPKVGLVTVLPVAVRPRGFVANLDAAF